MANEFDSELNLGYHTNVQDQTTLSVADVLGAATATVVDAGASIWNSLPLTENVDTSALLGRISNDALNVYNEHPDAIHTASFVAGMFLPLGVATKTMTVMRSGSKAVNWFTSAGRAADFEKATALFEAAQGATSEYRTLQRGIFAKSTLNAALDAVAGEVAVVATMHAAPMMEDYFKNPVENFGLSIALGGVLGGVIGHVGDRFALKQLTGAVEEGAIGKVFGGLKPVVPSNTNAAALQIQDMNIKNLQEMIDLGKEAGKTVENDLTLSYANKVQLQLKTQQATLFDTLVSPDIQSLSRVEKDAFMRTIIDKPEMLGVEKIKLLTEGDFEAAKLVKAPKFAPDLEPSLSAVNKAGDTVSKDAVYDPKTGLYMTKSDMVHYATAVVYEKNGVQLAKELPSNFGKIPNYDYSLELASKGSAEIDKDFIAAFHKIDQMEATDLAKLTISKDDAPVLNALIAKLRSDPELARKLKIKVADAVPLNQAIIAEKNQALTIAGAPADYVMGVQKFAGDSTVTKYAPFGADPLTPGGYNKLIGAQKEAGAMLRDWIAGNGVHSMRQAATNFFAKGYAYGSVKTDTVLAHSAKVFGEIYNSEGSKALRSQFQSLADSDGYVYLYRGSKAPDQTIRGHAPVESYSTNPTKSSEFGTTRLYKVHVEDIVAGFQDVAGHSGIRRNEIMVAAGARPIEATLSKDGKTVFQRAQAATIAQSSNTQGKFLPDLEDMLSTWKHENVDSLMAQGFPAQSIAIKTNTPIDVIERYMGMSAGKDAWDVATVWGHNVEGSDKIGMLYNNKDAIAESLDLKHMPLVLSGNLRKNPLIAGFTTLDSRTMSNINREFLVTRMMKSTSDTVKQMADWFYKDNFIQTVDIIAAELGKINNEFAGTRGINSFDFFARNMGSVGPAAAAISQEIQKIGNTAIGRVVSPIKDFMAMASKDPAHIVEFNTFYNVNARLSGWRMFDTETGKIMQKVDRLGSDGKPVQVLEAVKLSGEDYVVATKEVRSLITAAQDQAPELRELINTSRRIKGMPDVNDIGLWVPSFNPTNKHIGYVHNLTDDSTQLLWGRNEAELADRVKAYNEYLTNNGIQNVRVISSKSDQASWNLLNGRLDPILMKQADVTMQKSGASASAIISTSTANMAEMIGGYEHYITANVRNLAELNMSEITDNLYRMSKINTGGYDSQPLTEIAKMVNKPKDAAASVRNTLLGQSGLSESPLWSQINKSFETGINIATNTVAAAWDASIAPLTKSLFGKNKDLTVEQMRKFNYDEMAMELKSKGIVNPWAAFDDDAAKMFSLANLEDHPNTSKRIITASNALAATVALRFGELAQPIVNMISLPILTGLAAASRMPETFMGVAKGTANVSGTQIMFEGARASNSPLWKHLDDKWSKAGYYTPLVSEASDALRASRSFEKGPIATIENAIDSSFVKIMSKPADYSESLVRRQTMFTGAVLAKRLYPELDDVGVTIFARDFMDKAVGNFHASQRPIFFQGTLGTALGLFQTYSLTLGQSIYRQLEMKNYKALGKAALMQTGIFGAESLPGFKGISNLIGEHFSDENVDLTTGTYRAIPDRAADMLLYGMPSNLGPSISTRGDSDPRFPNVLGGLQNTVAVNFVQQTTKMIGSVAQAMQAPNPDVARALGQAISLQNMSRPLARGAELATGYSVTQQGNTVQVPEEVWTMTGIAARILSTRPQEEQKLREAIHLNTYYGAVDRKDRDKLTDQLKTSIRNDTLDETKLAKWSDEYLRHGGTAQGWRSAVNTAIAKTDAPGKDGLIEKLKPNNPLNFMIHGLDGY